MDGHSHVHRRKSSAGDDENTVLIAEAVPDDDQTIVLPPPRSRVHSTPAALKTPQSAGPYRTTFGAPKSPLLKGYNSSSPTRASFNSNSGHSRNRSISTPYSPPQPSPLSFSFPREVQPSPAESSPDGQNGSASYAQSRRHARLHSRNLSLFFPRPGSLPSSAISEDGSDSQSAVEIPVVSAPEARAGKPRLAAGFTFGARPPPNGAPSSDLPVPPLLGKANSSTRRGHHHKHSLSHNFFSFLDPAEQDLITQPTPSPISQWASPVSPLPARSPSPNERREEPPPEVVPMGAIAFTFAQFVLGAWLWVCGQQIGSLSCTGLGYWIVFDSFGMWLGNVLPGWLGPGDSKRERTKRPYGNARVETVFMFAQTVYLMFSSVYVCKETVEHVLLSMGGGDGHHHHHGDEEIGYGIEFPMFWILVASCSVAASSFFFNNHFKLVDVTGNRLLSPAAFIRSLSSTYHIHDPLPTTPWALTLTNPYTVSPLLFGVCILLVGAIVPSSQHSACDLFLASLVTVITFNVSYSAAFVLGTVLLQTSPARGTSTGRMEAFLRAMREVEKHPQVLHLPAPHIWQLTPASAEKLSGGTLIVTMELHVRRELPDEDALTLTKWAYDRCSGALGGEREVTVGVVRG